MADRWVVADLDVLSDYAHRIDLRHAGEWDEFHSRCADDTLHADVAKLVHMLNATTLGLPLTQLLYVSNRPMKFAQKTLDWMSANDVMPDEIIFKNDDDYEKDYLSFIRRVEAFFGSKEETLHRVWFVLSNKDKAVAALRDYGLNVWMTRP